MRVRVLHLAAIAVDETLEVVDGAVGRHIVRHKQLVPAPRLRQHFREFNARRFFQQYGAHLAALAF